MRSSTFPRTMVKVGGRQKAQETLWDAVAEENRSSNKKSILKKEKQTNDFKVGKNSFEIPLDYLAGSSRKRIKEILDARADATTSFVHDGFQMSKI